MAKIVETRHYYRVPYEITTTNDFKSLKYSTQVLYHSLCRVANDMADEEGWFYRGLKDLMIDSGLKRRTLMDAKKELIDKNYIETKRSYYKNTNKRSYDYYQINGFRFRFDSRGEKG